MRRSTTCAVMVAGLALMIVGIASAQGRIDTRWEFGAFGTYHGYADKLGVNAGLGAGARVDYHFRPDWAVESELELVDSHRWASGGENNEMPIRLRLAYHAPVFTNHQFIVGAGFSRFSFSPDVEGKRTSNQFGGVIGWQMALTRLFAVRVQGTWDRFAATESYAKPEKGNVLGVDFGLMWPGNAHPGDSDQDGILDDTDACPNTPAGDAVDMRGCSLPKDGDRDGITDPNDACPATPMGDKVDARGCSLPKDADNDGVIDPNDRCANTPAGTPVDAIGCPRDSDGDRVIDPADKCPNTPAGVQVDAAGCPLPPPDLDKDGVPDANDRCANTPIGTQVDLRGCPVLFEKGKTALVLQGVTFATGSANLTESSFPVLDRVAESLVGNPEVRLEVQGHTDNTGSATANTRLSQRRADAVRTYLISKGVDAARLTARGYGPTMPAVPNTTADGRAMNRRVELKQLP